MPVPYGFEEIIKRHIGENYSEASNGKKTLGEEDNNIIKKAGHNARLLKHQNLK